MKYYLLLPLLFAGCLLQAQKVFKLSSPDKNLSLELSTGASTSCKVFFKQEQIASFAALSLDIAGKKAGNNTKVLRSSTKSFNETIKPVVGKTAVIKDQYNELLIDFAGDYSLSLRAYDQGVAYRFITKLKGEQEIINEESAFELHGDYSALYSESPKLTSWELPYTAYADVQQISSANNIILPALFTQKSKGLRLLLAESDVLDYPGMFIRKSEKGFAGYWTQCPDSLKPYGGEWGMSTLAVNRKPYIAKTSGHRSFPWRILMVFDDDKKMLTNQLIYQLASPQKIKDVAWIKPGKADWEWWHDAIVEDAGFPTGMKGRSTQLYKHYVDFAAANGLEYTLIDAGWSNFHHPDTTSRRTDIAALSAYAKEKKVGLIVWVNATSLCSALDRNLDAFQRWGLKGIKVDFFDRDDQLISRQMEDIAAGAAKRQLLVDFHGCPKPTGLHRAYPNILNYEAIRGEECSKWDTSSNPAYHLQAAFIRMLGGPLDYTPGSMRNHTKASFKPVPEGLPLTQGTRCHELAMFILYDQYLGVLCDSPAEYRKYKDVMEFLSAVPVVYDETKVLAAKLSEYALIAKKKDNNWWVAAMSDWQPRTLSLDCSFLEPGKKYQAILLRDADNADTDAAAYKQETLSVNNTTIINLKLAPGGGAVLRFLPENASVAIASLHPNTN